MSEKKANHRADIVRLGEPRVHTNADTLEIYDIGGYQCVTKKGNFKAGDLAVYIQPDSVVPQTEAFKFLWEMPTLDDPAGIFRRDPTIIVPERKRRVTVRKFRKEWSEGLLMPLSDFPELSFGDGLPGYIEGDDVSDLLGITHWDGDAVETTQGDNDSRPKRKYPKTLKGWFYFLLFKAGFKGAKRQMNEELSFDVPKFDVENIKNFKGAIKPGEDVIVTEKIHGSQGRYLFREGKMYVGSRNFWKAENSPCVWRKTLRQNPWIEAWCRANEGHVLYGEVVPTQKGHRYGCEEDETNFFVFDIRNADGDYYPKPAVFIEPGLTRVPVIFRGPFVENSIFYEGPSLIDPKIMREGVVITVTDPVRWERSLGRIQLKRVSNAFLEKDSRNSDKDGAPKENS